jgi:hypothetical protein
MRDAAVQRTPHYTNRKSVHNHPLVTTAGTDYFGRCLFSSETVMIIQEVRTVRNSDPAAFSWSGLRRSQNVELMTQRLMQIHSVPLKHRENVRKQASQIRYCLIQAREYFSAASTVTLATKPNLLYYGTMSLALAEILFKQSGESSLDRARAENRHHGLTMSVGGFPKNPSLFEASQQLRANPVSIEGKRRGTFELWHRSSREHPLVGLRTNYIPTGGSTSGYRSVYSAADDPYLALPETGMTLAEAFSGIPLMAEYVHSGGLQSHLTRGNVRLDMRGSEDEWFSTHTLLFHPSTLNSSIIENISVGANYADRINCIEIGSGYQITVTSDWVNGHTSMHLPPAAMVDTSEWRMWSNKPYLNEFGHLYLALYLAGNYARYYPDKWLLDVETATPLALAIEELCNVSDWRVPWLSLCEMDMTLYVREA